MAADIRDAGHVFPVSTPGWVYPCRLCGADLATVSRPGPGFNATVTPCAIGAENEKRDAVMREVLDVLREIRDRLPPRVNE